MSSLWFSRLQPPSSESPPSRLFIFPHGGAGPGAYRAWARTLSGNFEIYAAHLPGRESRITEPPILDFGRLAASFRQALRAMPAQPVILFGHSMGALLAFEIARMLALNNDPVKIEALVVCGYPGPHLPNREPTTSHMSEIEFVEHLRLYGGTPPQVLGNDELLRMLLPMIRSDFRACESHQHVTGSPLQFPVLAYSGIDDPFVNRDELDAWRAHAGSKFIARQLPGNHFFLFDDRSGFGHVLHQDLLTVHAAGLTRAS